MSSDLVLLEIIKTFHDKKAITDTAKGRDSVNVPSKLQLSALPLSNR